MWFFERHFHELPEMMPIPIALCVVSGLWLSLNQLTAQDFAPVTSSIAVLVSLAIIVALVSGVRNFWGIEVMVAAGAIVTLSLAKSTKISRHI
ncbi:hypothetical protein HW450_12345 [Corynebacterium hindlerae]|uniref:Uncharacterized protein n=1 Tax=Corynebacterium hindlerae TaxID=699041 RepID=A0A7G5FEQ7_9CORY|nr:hypothetical protein [Corynebacterium hindlerae]QMV85098.1 hypothetical protein HW450_12345 [Corynebacterium hindlerae]